MKDAMIIPQYHESLAAYPANKWVVPETSKLLLDHWPLFTLKQKADFCNDTMKYCEAGAVNSEWVRDFTYVSSI